MPGPLPLDWGGTSLEYAAEESLIEQSDEELDHWHDWHPYSDRWTRFATHDRRGHPPRVLIVEGACWEARFWHLTNLANGVIQFLSKR